MSHVVSLSAERLNEEKIQPALNLIWCLQYVTGYAARASKLTQASVSPVVLGVLVVIMVEAIWAVSSGPLAHLDWRWLTVAGGLTYPLYLVHGQFGFFIIDVTHKTLPPYLVLLIAAGVSLILATALHYLVEERLHRPMRKAVQAALAKVGDQVPTSRRAR